MLMPLVNNSLYLLYCRIHRLKAGFKILHMLLESDHSGVNRASVSTSCSCEGENHF